MVATWPTTANQRSSISCCMFLWPVALSRLATPARGGCSSPATATASVAAGIGAGGGVGMGRIFACAAIGFAGAPAPLAPAEPGRAKDHQRQAVPGDRIDQVAVGKGDDREARGRPGRR